MKVDTSDSGTGTRTPVAKHIVKYMMERPNEEVHITDLVKGIRRTPEQIKMSIINLRSRNPDLGKHLQVILPGEVWRWQVTPADLVDPTYQERARKLMAHGSGTPREVRERLDSTRAEEVAMTAPEPPISVSTDEVADEVIDQLLADGVVRTEQYTKLFVTPKGTVLVAGPDGATYALKRVDLDV